jgi:hypothetical protein
MINRAGMAAIGAIVLMLASAFPPLTRAQGTAPTESQRRECERNGGYWATAAGMCKFGA